MKEILNIIHKTIYQFFDACEDDKEVPMSDKDKLLLEVNKAICNNLKVKALEQEPKWIPVSERLPEEDKQVLVTECFTTISGEKIYSISLANFYGDDWVTVHDEYKIDPSRHKVIAWRELPETYKAESEDDE